MKGVETVLRSRLRVLRLDVEDDVQLQSNLRLNTRLLKLVDIEGDAAAPLLELIGYSDWLLEDYTTTTYLHTYKTENRYQATSQRNSREQQR